MRITQQNGDGNRHTYSKNVDGGRGSSDKGLKTKGSKAGIINGEMYQWQIRGVGGYGKLMMGLG